MILALAAYHVILAFFFVVVGILLMGVILLQRGKGVGLSGAFGGTGGHTTFGAKTGDFLMWVTVAGAGVLLAFAIILNFVFVPSSPTLGGPARAPAPGPVSPGPGAPAVPPGAPSSGAPGIPMSPAPGMPPVAPMPAPPGPVNPAPTPAPTPAPAAGTSQTPSPAPGGPPVAPGGGTPPTEGSPTPGPVSQAGSAWDMPGTHDPAIAPLAIFGETA
jgi:preprotein translocase subunit SecG